VRVNGVANVYLEAVHNVAKEGVHELGPHDVVVLRQGGGKRSHHVDVAVLALVDLHERVQNLGLCVV